MNEWMGPDINVVGPLQLPPNDEFSILESSHFYGKFMERENQNWASGNIPILIFSDYNRYKHGEIISAFNLYECLEQ